MSLSPETLAGAVGVAFAFLRELVSRRSKSRLASAVNLGKQSAAWVLDGLRGFHVDTSQLVTQLGQRVREAGRAIGLSDAHLKAALEAGEAELGRLYLEDALGNLERELAKARPKFEETFRKADRL